MLFESFLIDTQRILPRVLILIGKFHIYRPLVVTKVKNSLDMHPYLMANVPSPCSTEARVVHSTCHLGGRCLLY